MTATTPTQRRQRRRFGDEQKLVAHEIAGLEQWHAAEAAGVIEVAHAAEARQELVGHVFATVV